MDTVTTSDNTTINLINVTGGTLAVTNSVSAPLSADYWGPTSVSAPSSAVPVPTQALVFSRDTGITTGDTWVFSTSFTVDGVVVTLEAQVVGEIWPAGSSMAQRITAGGADTGWWTSNDTRVVTFPGQSGATWSAAVSLSAPFGKVHADITVTVLQEAAPVTLAPVMPGIQTVVVLMLENRSLDNLLGMLYADSPPAAVYPPGSSTGFDGCPLTQGNQYHSSSYYPTAGTEPSGPFADTTMPPFDPGEDFGHVQSQLYADGEGTLPSGAFWETDPSMSGFAWDYDEFYTDNQSVMGVYDAAQLPVLYALAQSYAVSDLWFASVPSQTYTNRAFAMCGTALGKVDNSEIDGSTFACANTIVNVLAGAGKSWGVYWQTDGGVTAGSPPFQPFTPYFFPRLTAAPNGGVHAFDDDTDPASFLQAAASGTLPNFCFVEPSWAGGFPPFVVQGSDFHPPASVTPGDQALADLFNALASSPQWPNMLLVITFDEHGGTYDHYPSQKTVAPDDAPVSPAAAPYGFAFQRLGVRVPTLLVGPQVPAGMVFRSPDPTKFFDHTSLVATLCKWAGVDPAQAGLGGRVAQAPTFEGVVQLATPRLDVPTLRPNAFARPADWIDPFAVPAPEGAEGRPPVPVQFGDMHAAAHASATADEFLSRLQQLRYGRPKAD